MLEVVVVLCIMFSSVALVTSFQTGPPSPWTAIEEVLEQKTWDALYIAEDHLLPSTRCGGESMLEQLLIGGVRGESEEWIKWRDKFFAPGFRADLFLDNGDDIMLLHGTDDFLGVTESIHFTGNMSYALPVPTVSTVSGLERLNVPTAGIRDGKLLRAKGEALDIRVAYSSLGGISEGRRSTAALTAVLNTTTADSERHYAQDLAWSRANSDALLTRQMTGPETSGDESVDLYLSLGRGFDTKGVPVSIPAGLRLEIQFPPGWTLPNIVDAEWIDQVIDAPAGPLLRATLDVDSGDDLLEITARAPPGSTDPFDAIHARLLGTSLGESTIVLTRPDVALPERDLPRRAYATTPYPVRPGTEALFGVVFANGGDAIEIDAVEIEVPGGYDLAHHAGAGTMLFKPGTTPVPKLGGGEWTIVDAQTLRWTPDDPVTPTVETAPSVPSLGAIGFAVSVMINDADFVATSVENGRVDPPSSTLDFSNEYESTSSRWAASPGVLLHTIPPADPLSTNGYPTSVQVHEFDASTRDHRRPVEGEGAYRLLATATDVTSVENALADSSFRVASRLVPVGTVVRMDADIENLASLLGDLGAVDATVEVELYSPITRGCPTRRWTTPLDSLPTPSVTDMVIWDGGTTTPGVYAAIADGRVYRLGETGASFAFGSESAILAHGSRAGTALLYVGASSGTIYALDAETMEEVWSLDLAQLHHGTQPSSLLYDEERGHLLVGSTRRLFAIDANTGVLVEDELVGDQPIEQIAVDGKMTYALTRSALVRLDETFAIDYSMSANLGEEYLGFGVSDQYVMLSASYLHRVFDKESFATLSSNTLPESGGVPVIARGHDANDDGVGDLVIVSSTNAIWMIDGATRSILGLGSFDYSGLTNPPTSGWGVEGLECSPSDFLLRYITSVTCGVPSSENGPKKIVVTPGATGVLYSHEGTPGLWWRVAGEEEQYAMGDPNDPWSVAALGMWGSERAYAFGTLGGIVRSYSDGPIPDVSSAPSDRVGQFSVYAYMPKGGFYGSHLMVLEVSWTQSGKEQAARMIDWFEVVRADGTPVEGASYEVVLVASDGAHPMGWSPGRN